MARHVEKGSLVQSHVQHYSQSDSRIHDRPRYIYTKTLYTAYLNTAFLLADILMNVSNFYNMTTMIFFSFWSSFFFNTSNEGWKGLMEEMEMEVKRISKRNLGRDDRLGSFQIHYGSSGQLRFFLKTSLPIKLLTGWILVALLTDWPRDGQTDRTDWPIAW